MAGPTYGFPPLTVNFINLSAGAISGYQWNFGDGTVSAEEEPSHDYTEPGNYPVVLTAYGTDGSSEYEAKENYIKVFPDIPCPMSGTLDEKKDVARLRRLRDSMGDTVFGIILISIYYQSAAEISAVMDDNPELQHRLRELVLVNISAVERIIKNEDATMSEKRVDEVVNFLLDLRDAGSHRLERNIDFIIMGLEQGFLLEGIGISVCSGSKGSG